MAEQSEEDFKKFREWSKERSNNEKEIVETMRDQLDLSKQLSDAMDNISQNLADANAEHDLSKKAVQDLNAVIEASQQSIGQHNNDIQKQLRAISDINKNIAENNTQLAKNKELENELLGVHLALSDKLHGIHISIKNLQEEKNKAVKEESLLTENISNLQQHMKKNDSARMASTELRIKYEQKEFDTQVKLKALNEEISAAQLAAIHNGIVDQSKYNKMVLDAKKLEKESIEFKNALVEATADENKYLERGKKLSDEIYNSELNRDAVKSKMIDIGQESAKLTAEEKNLSKQTSDIWQNILEIQDENAKINSENVDLTNAQAGAGKRIAQSKSLIKEENKKIAASEHQITLEEVKQKELLEKINKLQASFVLTNLVMQAVDRFIKLDKAAEDFRISTGFSADQMRDLRSNAESLNRQFQDMGVSMEAVYKSASALTDVFGRTTLVSKEALQNVSLLSANLGVAEKDSADVLANFQGLGGATEKAAMNVIKVGAGISENAGVPFKMVMNDIANASSDTLNLVGATPDKLMKSAIAARALGTDINKIAATQQKLLNYSSSITSELSASALLGKSISFQKARQLAYDGDAIGAAKATLDTVKKAGDFNKMTVYQKKELAEAAGMELKDLTKMMAVEKQRDAILLNGTEEQKSKLLAQEAELENLKSMASLDSEDLAKQNEKAIMQQKIQGLMTNMKNTIESIVIALQDVFEPIVRVAMGILIPVFKILAAFVRGLLTPLHSIGKALMGNADGAKKVGVAFDAIGKFMIKVYEGAEKFGEIVGNILYPVMQIYGIFEAIFGTVQKFQPLLESVERITRTVAAFFLNISRSITIFSNGLTGISAIFKPIANMVAMIARGFSFVAKYLGPIGLIITAVQVVVDWVTQLVDIWTSDDMSVGDKILESLVAIPNALYNVMVKPFISAIDWVLDYFHINFSVGEFFKEWLNDMMNLGTMMIQPFVNSMYEIWEAVTNIFDGKEIGMNILKGLFSVGKLITQALYWPFTAAWGLISGWLGQSPSELGDGIVTGIKAVGSFVLDALTWPFRAAFNFVSELFGGNGDFVTSILGGIKMAAGFVFDVLTLPFRSILDFVSGMFGGDGELGTSIIEGIKNIASLIFDIIVSPFKKAIAFVKGLPLIGKLFGGADDISKQTVPSAESVQKVETKSVVEVAHLDELRDAVMELASSIANLGTIKTDNIVNGTKMDTSALENKLDTLTNLLVGGAVRVYLDGKDVSAAMSSVGR